MRQESLKHHGGNAKYNLLAELHSKLHARFDFFGLWELVPKLRDDCVSGGPGAVPDCPWRSEPNEGFESVVRDAFDILPVEFVRRENPFQAYIFLCCYNGTVDDKAYSFRKCYARGCTHNLCPHVSQAVMIASWYLRRDYYKLEQVGIEMEKELFTLEEMTVKFDGYQEVHDPLLAIYDYICPFARGKCPITDLGQQVDRSARCVIDRTGQEVPILKSVKRIEFNGQEHLLETFMDISAVAEKERLVGVLEMAGAATHHLSQPLQALMFDLDGLLKQLLKRWAGRLDTMLESTGSMQGTIRNIQDITRYQTREYIKGTRIVDIDGASFSE